jgi:outer membrane murein-binding lipoprotein Lpp
MTALIIATLGAAIAAIGYLAGRIHGKSELQEAINAAEDSAEEAWGLAAKYEQLAKDTQSLNRELLDHSDTILHQLLAEIDADNSADWWKEQK